MEQAKSYAVGKHGRRFEFVQMVMHATETRMYELAQWRGKCATCGEPFLVTTPRGCAKGAYSHVFELANCARCRFAAKARKTA